MLSCSSGCGSSIDGQQVFDGERCSCRLCETEMNSHDIVETQRREIANPTLEDGSIEAGVPIL